MNLLKYLQKCIHINITVRLLRCCKNDDIYNAHIPVSFPNVANMNKGSRNFK